MDTQLTHVYIITASVTTATTRLVVYFCSPLPFVSSHCMWIHSKAIARWRRPEHLRRRQPLRLREPVRLQPLRLRRRLRDAAHCPLRRRRRRVQHGPSLVYCDWSSIATGALRCNTRSNHCLYLIRFVVCVFVGWFVWLGLGWVGLGLGWVWLGWVGLGSAGFGWAGLGWAGSGWVGLFCLLDLLVFLDFPRAQFSRIPRILPGRGPSDTFPMI